ncbi:uncharacterized protein A1O9_11959 [Exophiala aquamarina CBS 119918]|uniref:3-oxoacyl-[acyl-carrier protein] reductase n=1 Tax=Exophiala aquamarina CBS 119918 TaxID=1182545 RepID=A0A072NVS5_9EURO|nr:uncharacterized protein A1O9_11959 [Exophiala aquamarina CBS 119918]KEF51969.1 hypothetical protein A1O9_11959 [Exophiala aquamarina CBS 119918]
MAQLPIYENKFLQKFSLKGRTIVITGGGRGLGLTFANGLAQAGANIAVIDIAAQPSDIFSSLAYGGKYQYYRGDVTDYEGLGKIIEQISHDFGGIHGCIAAAGVIVDKPFLEHTPSDLDINLNVNVKGVFYTVQHCAMQIRDQGDGGSIVAIASTASHKSPAAHAIAAYTASKYAIRGFIGQIAKELAKYKIRVNTVSPGCMQTELLQMVLDEHPERLPLFAGTCALNRIGQPQELCGMLLYLLSDLASFTTGQDFIVDGSSV